ncbi:MAG: hypothetical protein ACJAXX_003081 [Roseivirga sp.]|jgi:uncharacterized protein (TIGR00661 family)
MKALFIVQGEGRGHMTQALALEQILIDSGHEVLCIIIGACSGREVPAYFKKRAIAPIHTVASPHFFYDKEGKSIHLTKTFFYNMMALPKFLKELKKIDRWVEALKPDVIINFYDIIGGFYFTFFRPKMRRICIAHQYLASHKEFPFAEGFPFQKACFTTTNRLTSLAAHKTIALSFKHYQSDHEKTTIAPPLLRKEVFELSPTQGDYILAYVVNAGYAFEIMEWHEQNKKIKLHCFWDNKEQADGWSPWKNITFHQINDQKFLGMMENCLGYISTAGFESICEAMYLGKPAMMVPVENQYEQACNALDAVKSGAGIASTQFYLEPLLNYLSTHDYKDLMEFQLWVKSTKQIILNVLEHEVSISKKRKTKLTLTYQRIRMLLSKPS